LPELTLVGSLTPSNYRARRPEREPHFRHKMVRGRKQMRVVRRKRSFSGQRIFAEAMSYFVNSRQWNYSNWAGTGAALFFILLCGLFAFEPKDASIFENVTVVSYSAGPKRCYFTVESTTSDKAWEVDPASSPFSSNYRGPAILAIRHGHWTGRGHFQLLVSNALTNQPSIK
jgi:hypothetical protein